MDRHGLGYAPVVMAVAPSFGPAAPIVIGASLIAPFVVKLLGDLGAGRKEADVIVEIQNALIHPSGTGQLDQITDVLVSNPNVSTLQDLYFQVERIGADFLAFLQDPQFRDGRASAQAANTIMPYIDGTCGYTWPALEPSQRDCLRWGDGTPGGAGTDGMLGAIARAISRLGGTLPPPLITHGYGSTLPRLAPSSLENFPILPQPGNLQYLPAPLPAPLLHAGIGEGWLPIALMVGAGLLLQRRH